MGDELQMNEVKTTESVRVLRWTQKMLDLTLRNRLLNARDSQEVLPLKNDDLSALEDRLAAGQPVSFGADAVKMLVSDVSEAETKKRLTRLYRAARTDISESGVNTLFLALGFLTWQTTQNAAKVCRAPLVLVPVVLTRKTPAGYELLRRDEETVVNPTLIEFLRTEFHLTVTGVDPVPMDEKGVDLSAIFAAFEKGIASQASWGLARTAMLGRFSFGKFVMWKDLTSRLETLRRHPLVEHLVSGNGVYDDGIEVFPPEEIAQNVDFTDLYCPLAADSSQLTAVLYARKGKTFVLHGPPGTGKSQTIANMIADNLVHGRRVLFVAEKKAALDVVMKRLARLGLKPFCLELHSNKAGKAEVLAQFAEALETKVLTEDPERLRLAKDFEKTRHELAAYVQALHKPLPSGVTPYACLSQAIAERATAREFKWTGPAARTWTREAYQAAGEVCEQLARDLMSLSAPSRVALAPLTDTTWSPAWEQLLVTAEAAWRAASTRGFFARLGAAFRYRTLMPFCAAWRMMREPAQVEAFQKALPDVRAALRYRSTRRTAEQAGLTGFVEYLESLQADGKPFEAARELFDRAFKAQALNEILSSEPVLAQFNGLDQNARVARFRELDAKLAQLVRDAAFARISDHMPLDLAAKTARTSELGILRRECEKKQRHKPIRQLLAEAPTLTAQLKPCFLMSPLSVAQYLPPEAKPFDLVIFDEASQMPVWDAVGVIARARQLIVVGDPRQMPPTSFFEKDDSAETDETDVPEDMESILDECLAAGVHSAYLNWHYRSRHEDLIAFSNHHYYEDRLFTFPAASTSPRLGVRFEYVAEGVYDRTASRTNRREAEALVDWVFARLAEPDYHPRSLGIVTFSQAQQDLVEDLFEKRRAEDSRFEAFFAEGNEESFFVKNLENVQGDERDVILFSIGYAYDKTGKMAMNFGPLNRAGGERRLNVAVTRAREQIVVFSSIKATDIDLSRTSAVGAAHLKSFLEFAEKGPVADRTAKTDSTEAFPQTVAAFLRAKGFEVAEGVGTGACRVDLAVRRPGDTDWRVAVECDGPSYAVQLTVRDRDQVRPGVLQSLGWQTIRLWSADWALDRARAEKALLAQLA